MKLFLLQICSHDLTATESAESKKCTRRSCQFAHVARCVARQMILEEVALQRERYWADMVDELYTDMVDELYTPHGAVEVEVNEAANSADGGVPTIS